LLAAAANGIDKTTAQIKIYIADKGIMEHIAFKGWHHASQDGVWPERAAVH
jgi:hypothetical protein